MDDKIKSALIYGLAIVLTGFLLGMAFKNRNENLDSISVIGLGTKDFVSDEILWSGTFTATSPDLKSAYNKITADKKTVSVLEQKSLISIVEMRDFSFLLRG